MSYRKIQHCLQNINKSELLEKFEDEGFDDDAVLLDLSNGGFELQLIFPSYRLTQFESEFQSLETMETEEIKIENIIQFNSTHPYFALKDEELKEILSKSDGMKVGFLSTIGSSESAFYINYVMRNLAELKKGNVDFTLYQNMDEFSSPLKGFNWEKGKEQTQPGISITSSPFIIQNGGENLAIYVLNTTFFEPIENFRNMNDRLAFLQLILSSLTIYLIPEQKNVNIFPINLPLKMKWHENSNLNLGRLFFLLTSKEFENEDPADFLEKYPDLKEHLNIFTSIQGLTISNFPDKVFKKSSSGSLEEIDDFVFIEQLDKSIKTILNELHLGKGLEKLEKKFFNEPISNENFLSLLGNLIKIFNEPLRSFDEFELNDRGFASIIESMIKFAENNAKAFYLTSMTSIKGDHKFLGKEKFIFHHEQTKEKAINVLKSNFGQLPTEALLNHEQRISRFEAQIESSHRIQLTINEGEKRKYLERVRQNVKSEFETISTIFVNLTDEEFLEKFNKTPISDLMEAAKSRILYSLDDELTTIERDFDYLIEGYANSPTFVALEQRYVDLITEIQRLQEEQFRREAEEESRLRELKIQAVETLEQNSAQSLNDFKAALIEIDLKSEFRNMFDQMKKETIEGFQQIDFIEEFVYEQKKMELAREMEILYYNAETQFEDRKINDVNFIFELYAENLNQQLINHGKAHYTGEEIDQFDINARQHLGKYFKNPSEIIVNGFESKVDEILKVIKEESLKTAKIMEIQFEEEKLIEAEKELTGREIENKLQEIKESIKKLAKKMEEKILQGEVKTVREFLQIKINEIETIKEKLENTKLAFTNNEIQMEIKNAFTYLKSLESGDESLRLDVFILDNIKIGEVEKEIGIKATELIEAKLGEKVECGEIYNNIKQIFDLQIEDVKNKLLTNEVLTDFKQKKNITCDIDIERLKKKIDEALKFKLHAYSEQNRINAAKKNPVLGVDFGTTYISCTVSQNGKSNSIQIDQGQDLSPSVVAYIMPTGEDDNSFGLETHLVGIAAKKQDFENPFNTIYEPKRILGRTFDDERLQYDLRQWQTKIVKGDNGNAMIKLSNGNLIDPKDVVVLILKKLRGEAIRYCKMDVTFVVITIPVQASNEYNEVLYKAAQEAGFQEICFMREPIAAAVSYRMHTPELRDETSRKILIFDFGGGTLDLCIIESDINSIKVLEIGGDPHFGGRNFDQAIFDHFIEKSKTNGEDYLQYKYSEDPAEAELSKLANIFERRFLNEIENAKCKLSNEETIKIELVQDTKNIEFQLSRDEFNEINKGNFKNIRIKLERMFERKIVEKHEITHVILVGGMSNVTKVKETLVEFFGPEWNGKWVDEKDKQLAVAFGAGRQAAKLFGDNVLGNNSDLLDKYKLEDIVPSTIGIGIKGNQFKIVIPRGSVIPFKGKVECTNGKKGKQVFLPIFEGEAEEMVLTSDPLLSKVGSLALETSESKAGADLIDVYFEYDCDLRIRIKAINHTNKTQKELEILSEFARRQAAKENLKKRVPLLEDDDESDSESDSESEDSD